MCPANESGATIVSDPLIQTDVEEKGVECDMINRDNQRILHGILHRLPLTEVID